MTLSVDVITTLVNLGILTNSEGDQTHSDVALTISKIIVDQMVLNVADISNLTTDQATSAIQATIDLLPLVTRSDGTVNSDLLITLLRAQGVSSDLVDSLENSEFIDNMQASTVEDFLSQSKQFIEDANTTDFTAINKTAVAYLIAPAVQAALNYSSNYTITQQVASPNGKWQENIGNVMMIDAGYIVKDFLQRFFEQLRTQDFSNVTSEPTTVTIGDQTFTITNASSIVNTLAQNTEFQNSILNITNYTSLDAFALTSNIVLNDKLGIYSQANSIKTNLIEITDKIMETLGIDYPASVTAPLGDAVQTVILIKLFIDNTFLIIIFLLVILSVLLIYSLMNSNVEEKTYEFGMLRALGFLKTNLISLMVIQALFFAIPGMVMGMMISYVINAIVEYVILNYTNLSKSYQLDGWAIFLGMVVSIGMPIVSNILPIMRALSKTLRDSLNIYSRVINEIHVQILKLEKMGLSPTQFLVASMLVILGIITYYFAPYAIIFQNFEMFLYIMNIILILLILGYTFFINLSQPFVERLLLRLILLCVKRDRVLQTVVLKNFESHKRRNTKTALMFSISLAFLIFSGTTIALQSNLIVNQLRAQFGSDFVIMSTLGETKYFDEYGIRQFMAQYMNDHPGRIKDYTFTTVALDDLPGFSSPDIAPLAEYPERSTTIVGVEQNYLNSIYEDLIMISEYNKNLSYSTVAEGVVNVVDGLYTNDSMAQLTSYDQYKLLANQANNATLSYLNADNSLAPIKMIIAEGLRYMMSLTVDTPARITSEYIKYRGAVRASAVKIPGYYFSGYRQIAFFSTTLVSMTDFRILVDNAINNDYTKGTRLADITPPNSTYGIPKSKFLMRFATEVNATERAELKNMLSTYVPGIFSLVVDMVSTAESISNTLGFLNLFFLIVAAISLILSFFLILVSFVSNIKENAWEFGVLRAIGLDKSQMTRIYIYEALCLTLGASILGTIVGLVTAISIVQQFNLFMEMPFQFNFPWAVFFFSIVLAVVTSVLGSKSALDVIKKRQISSIVKGLDQ